MQTRADQVGPVLHGLQPQSRRSLPVMPNAHAVVGHRERDDVRAANKTDNHMLGGTVFDRIVQGLAGNEIGVHRHILIADCGVPLGVETARNSCGRLGIGGKILQSGNQTAWSKVDRTESVRERPHLRNRIAQHLFETHCVGSFFRMSRAEFPDQVLHAKTCGYEGLPENVMKIPSDSLLQPQVDVEDLFFELPMPGHVPEDQAKAPVIQDPGGTFYRDPGFIPTPDPYLSDHHSLGQ